MLLGTARYLAETRNFDGTVHFIFQPAEEGLGGARAMIRDGLFEKFPCDEIYGLHNATDLNHGEVGILPGAAMAGADFFDITITGYGAHGARPERSKDPIVIAMTLGQALQTIVSRNVSPSEPAVLSITQIHAGTAYNVIPGDAKLCGTVRAFSDELRELIRERMRALCAGMAVAFDVEITADIRDTFSVLVNQQEQSNVIAEVARTVVDPAQGLHAAAAEDGQRGFRRHAAGGARRLFLARPRGIGARAQSRLYPRRQDPARSAPACSRASSKPDCRWPPMHKSASDEAVTPLHDLSAVDLIAGFRARQFSPSEVLEDVLAHLAVWEPHLKALYAFDPEGARAVAKASTERWHNGEPTGSLDGVPVTIKDNIATKGVPVPLGAATTKLVPAPADAPPAARLREAGAVIFSKTTMPDYGMLSSGLSSFHPLTRNPWDLSKNPGGSSSGAAAGAAAGYGPLHLGTDIGGSVRLPACWCGLVALKPSLGRIPVDPPYVGRVAGPMTRTVDDAALMMSVLSKPDRRDGMSLPPNDINWKALDKSPRKLRIGLMLDLGVGQALEQEVRERRREGREGVRGGRRRRHRNAGHSDARDARRARPFLARADVGRSFQADAGRTRQGAALYLQMGGKRRETERRRCGQGLQRHHGDPGRGGETVLRVRLCDFAGIAGGEFPRRVRRPDQRSRCGRSSTSATPCHGTWRKIRRPRSMADTTRRVFRSACRSSAAASTIIGVLGMAKTFEGLRGPQKPWPKPPK